MLKNRQKYGICIALLTKNEGNNMAKKHSDEVAAMVAAKKEALRYDSVVENADFSFPETKTNKAIMTMDSESKKLSAKDACIAVNYYYNDDRVIRCVMQPCGDVYVTKYKDNKEECCVVVNEKVKEGILIDKDNEIKEIPSNDKKTKFAKRVSTQSIRLWKGYFEGKHKTTNQKNMGKLYEQVIMR